MLLPTIHWEHLRSRMCQLCRQDPPSPSGGLCRAQSEPVIGVCSMCDLSPKAREVESGAGKRGASILLGTVGRQEKTNKTKAHPHLPPSSCFTPFSCSSNFEKTKGPAFSHKRSPFHHYPIACQGGFSQSRISLGLWH